MSKYLFLIYFNNAEIGFLSFKCLNLKFKAFNKTVSIILFILITLSFEVSLMRFIILSIIDFDCAISILSAIGFDYIV